MKESKRLKYEKRICELENELAKQAYRTLSSKILGARYLPVHYNCRSWQAPITTERKVNKVLEYSILGIENVYRIIFEDSGEPIITTYTTSDEIVITCGAVTIARFAGLIITQTKIADH